MAYSTCSQLGYVIFACGISNYSVSVFHFMNHVCFKALLFLSAGLLIHALSYEQDMRKIKGLHHPLTRSNGFCGGRGKRGALVVEKARAYGKEMLL
jgi:NADH:ubiquinone oxidoreductase subunit 5 (subunit L)/multisubunit Na+/H+ antiporter MnhA subunit